MVMVIPYVGGSAPSIFGKGSAINHVRAFSSITWYFRTNRKLIHYREGHMQYKRICSFGTRFIHVVSIEVDAIQVQASDVGGGRGYGDPDSQLGNL